MALIKEIELGSGVTVRYHRVMSVTAVTNVQTVIELASYTSREKREDEVAAVAAGAEADVFVETRYYAAPYDPGMTCRRAYEWLKESLPEMEGAEDALEEGDGADEVTGEEFMSMLGEVL